MRGREAGFTLVSAIFLLVVIAAAGAATVRITGVQRSTASFALLGARAHHAAASGVEWMRYQALNVPGSCPVSPPNPPASVTFTLNEGGLMGFRVTVTCGSDAHVEGVQTVTRFHVTSLAEWDNFGDRDYVSRRLEATITDGA